MATHFALEIKENGDVVLLDLEDRPIEVFTGQHAYLEAMDFKYRLELLESDHALWEWIAP